MGFIADEVLEMAEQIERNGVKFYRAAAEGATGDVSGLFNRLAEMEERHGDTFHDMRAKLTPEETVPATADPDDLAGKYLRSMVEGKVFDVSFDPAEKLATLEGAEEVLSYAIALEHKAISFFGGLKDSMSADDDIEKLNAIIDEEKSHVIDLSAKLDEIRT